MNDTKEHIIKTTFLLFANKSYKEVTLKDIIRETGLSNGAFYHYFESKEQLFKEIIDTYLFSIVRRIWEYYPKDSLWNFIHDTLSDMEKLHKQVADILETGGGFNFLILLFEACKQFPDVKEKINQMHKLEFASWIEIIDIAKMKGEIKTDLPTEVLARMFSYLPDGAHLDFLIDGNMTKYEFGTKRLWEGLYSLLKD
ncbi:MAG: TetR/AcrR family transcriptional regulator [Bacteroidales bacterium]|jgi:AcrR family transcriptional regulator|nr:TetR/AcrR family transcriptional regulator [Bacteroidales bacterium]